MESEEQKGEIFVSIDGCRTRGYSQILVLREIMHNIQLKMGSEEVTRVSDHVSIIGGSGMGGIISIFMGRFRMETPAALKAYERFCNDVYKNEDGAPADARYDSEVFEETFRVIAKDSGFNADDPMEEEEANCKTVVFATNARNTTEIQAIRSYRVRSAPNPPFTILQAARATMASPDLFPSVYVGSVPEEKEFVAYFTNPIKFILEEAGNVYEDTTKVACVLSLGSGAQHVKGLPEDPRPSDRMKLLADIAENCEAAHQEAASRHGHSGIYHRINVERNSSATIEDEWEDGFTPITQATHDYIQANTRSFDRILDCFVRRIGGPTIRDLNRVPTLETAFPPPPTLTKNFVGRSDLVKAILEYHLSRPSSSRGSHRTTVLSGLGGIGKTQLSIKVWHEIHSLHPDMVIFFLDARSTVNLENSLQQLIRSRDARFWNGGYRDALFWLGTTKTPWLMILDNADDPDMDLSPYIPAGEENHIVITSRNPARRVLAPDSHYEVGELDPEDSIKLLLSTARISITAVNMADAHDITAALHHHSLAIVQAGGYILRHGQISEYLSILNRKRDQLLLKKHVEEPNYPLTVYASFQLSLDQLPAATQDILWVLSFLNSAQIDEAILVKASAVHFVQNSELIETIPSLRGELADAASILKRLLCPSGEWDPYDFSENISSAIQYSLLSVTETENGQRFYSMHPLIESFLRDTLPTEKKALSGLSVRIIAAILELDDSEEILTFNRQLLPHITALSSVQPILPIDHFAMAKVLIDGGLYDLAQKHVASASHRLDEDEISRDNRLFLRIMWLQGVVWYYMGKYDDALQIQGQVLQTQAQVSGSEHPDTLDSMNDFAAILESQGKYTEAVEMSEQVLDARKKVLGEGHPRTLISMNGLAVALYRQGEYTRAVELGEQALEIESRLLGEEHANTLNAMNNLCVMLQKLGNHTKAIALGERGLEISIRVLGDEHPDTLAQMHSLARALQMHGDYTKAADLGEQVLKMMRKSLGDDHPSTVSALDSLATTSQRQGDYVKAADLGKQAWEKWTVMLGAEHPSTLLAKARFAVTLQAKGDYPRGLELIKEAYEDSKKALGESNLNTLEIKGLLDKVTSTPAVESKPTVRDKPTHRSKCCVIA